MSEGIKVISATLPSELETLDIIPIGDVHKGDKFFWKELFIGLVEYILEKPNRFALLNGDLINNAIKTSVSDSYGHNDPEEEIEEMAKILTPIKERILAMGSGNHEERTSKLAGIDPSRYLATLLGIEERYSSNSFVLFLTFGHFRTPSGKCNFPNVYTIFVQHGYGGGKKNGSKLNALNDSDQIISNADLFIMGHTHTPIANVKSSFVADTRHGTIKRQNKYFLMHNAFMKFGGYGLRYGYSPAATEITYATLSGRKKKISLTIGI